MTVSGPVPVRQTIALTRGGRVLLGVTAKQEMHPETEMVSEKQRAQHEARYRARVFHSVCVRHG